MKFTKQKLVALAAYVAGVFRAEACAPQSALELFGPYVSQNEGFRASPYQDTAGHWTVGVGHRLLPHEAVKVYTPAEIAKLFRHDLLVAVEDARLLVPSFDRQPLAVRTVLVDLAFNLGRERLSKFRRMLHEINYGRYDQAATDLQFSLYYKQAQKRAARNAAMLRSVP